MALGDSFPLSLRRDSVRRQLAVGVVIKLTRRMDDGQVHEKRYVVLHVDADKTTACVINSAISRFIQDRKNLLRCQVAMSAATHGFMDHDSYVDGSRTWVYATDSVVEELMSHGDWILGTMTGDLRDRLVAALLCSPALSQDDVDNLTKSLRGMGAKS